jgi:hypothetical protein
MGVTNENDQQPWAEFIFLLWVIFGYCWLIFH